MVDVEQMFHQVHVAPDDCHASQFLWWEDGDLSRNPVDHQMLVIYLGRHLPVVQVLPSRKQRKILGTTSMLVLWTL